MQLAAAALLRAQGKELHEGTARYVELTSFDLMRDLAYTSAVTGGPAPLKEQFSTAAAARFGSGWAWLGVKGDGSLGVTKTPNQDNPISSGDMIPILGLDVWEHAYYLHYQNRRPDYIEAWWNVVDWKRVEGYYTIVKVGDKVLSIADWAKAQWEKFEEILQKLTE